MNLDHLFVSVSRVFNNDPSLSWVFRIAFLLPCINSPLPDLNQYTNPVLKSGDTGLFDTSIKY